MRSSQKEPIFLEEKNNFFGINLPADYCAEHEWGIKSIKQLFGIPELKITEEPFGLVRRKSTKVPEIEFIDDGKHLHLILRKYSFQKGQIPFGLCVYCNCSMGSAWDGDEFGIIVDKKNKDCCEKLTKIKEAIDNNDVCVFLGGGGVFENAGLNIVIASKIPQENIKKWEDGDAVYAKLYRDAEATGIEEKLNSAGKKFYALSPSRMLNGKKSKHNVMFWLNPQDQRNVNYGWFTVEELEQWIDGKGPIPMKKK